LAGHFPGNPVVAGVLLLEAIITAAESRLGHRVTVARLPLVKFLTPLQPGQEARLELEFAGPQVEFALTRGASTVAKGRLLIDVPPARG
jgi:3-hydroxymyristoyl/3-hydroxydecanoyl-(acyl carrier protein) dehydratase